jgi:hypothetical protein
VTEFLSFFLLGGGKPVYIYQSRAGFQYLYSFNLINNTKTTYSTFEFDFSLNAVSELQFNYYLVSFVEKQNKDFLEIHTCTTTVQSVASISHKIQRKKEVDRGRDRTCNLLIPRPQRGFVVKRLAIGPRGLLMSNNSETRSLMDTSDIKPVRQTPSLP